MPNPYQPPRGRRITLAELLLSVFLLAFGVGMIRLMYTLDDHAVLWGSVAELPIAFGGFAVAACSLAAGAAILVGRLVFAEQCGLGRLVIVGGAIVLLLGFVLGSLFLPRVR